MFQSYSRASTRLYSLGMLSKYFKMCCNLIFSFGRRSPYHSGAVIVILKLKVTGANIINI